jgi:CheY-like chemotaxis protein
LTRSDVPAVEITADAPVENFCEVGDMVCDIFKKLGATCKAGTKTGACPQKKARKGKAAAAEPTRDVKKLIAIDQPFDYDEVVAVTGPEYAASLEHDGMAVMPYEALKANVVRMDAESRDTEKQFPVKPVHPPVLVIDDEVAVNNNIRKILQKKGYQVEQATGKDEALEIIDEDRFGLVLLDLKMPGVRGLELLQAIRDKQPEAKVIIITGYATIQTAVEAARMGAVDYLPKPFTPDEVRNATDQALQLAA